MARNRDIVPARFFCSRNGLISRDDLVVPPPGGDNKINPDRRHKADGIPGATVDSPRLNGWRWAAISLMAYRPFPDA
jgi:hypothetical protein